MTYAITIACFLILIAGLFAVIVERTNERDDARAERDRLERELEARPRLRLVPRQRDGSEYEWPRLARQIEDDDIEALMRATEEK